MTRQHISLQSVVYGCKAQLHEIEALARSGTFPSEAMLAQVHQSFSLTRALSQAVGFDPMELMTISIKDSQRILALDDIPLPSTFHDALAFATESIGNAGTRSTVRSQAWWAERLCRYAIRAARMQAEYSVGLTVPDRRLGPKPVAPTVPAVSQPTSSVAVSEQRAPAAGSMSDETPPKPPQSPPVPDRKPSAAGTRPLLRLTVPELVPLTIPMPAGAVDDTVSSLPATADVIANEGDEPYIEPMRGNGSVNEVAKTDGHSDQRSGHSTRLNAHEPKQQIDAVTTPAVETAEQPVPASEPLAIPGDQIAVLPPSERSEAILAPTVEAALSDVGASRDEIPSGGLNPLRVATGVHLPDHPSARTSLGASASSRPEDIAIIREPKVSYIRPQDGAVALELAKALSDIWLAIARQAFGEPDQSVAPQLLAPAERGFRGTAPTPTSTRHILTVTRAGLATAGDFSGSIPLPEETCRSRPASHFSRLDIPSLFSQYFEVAPKSFENLILYGVFDTPNLEVYISELKEHLQTVYKQGRQFSEINPPSDNHRIDDKPIYLKSAKVIRNKPQAKIVALESGYWFSKDVRDSIEQGRHTLVFSPAGSGKTLLLKSIHLDFIYRLVRFNAAQNRGKIESALNRENIEKNGYEGNWAGIINKLENIYTTRTALLVDECTFLTPLHLSQMSVFDQIVMVGDPCQLGAPLAVEFVRDFMSRINAFVKEDGIVYRTNNPALFNLLNYIGYDGKFTASKLRDELTGLTFQIVECKQHLLSKAASIVLATLWHAKQKRSVLIATQDYEVSNLVNALIQHDIDIREPCHGYFEMSSLSTLQGKQADVLIIDPSEVDEFIDEPYTAVKFLTMVLGRATSTICLITPDREVAKSVEEIRPFGLMLFGCCQYEPHSIVRGNDA